MQSHDPLLLFYTPHFSEPVDVSLISCDLPGRWTVDRRRTAEAAAVIFHIPNFREFGDARKYPGQIWVAWSQESWQNYPVMRDPAFMAKFDLRITYEADADMWAPYLPKRAWWNEVRTRPLQPKTSPVPMAMFQSSRFNLSGRDRFVDELARHIAVDSYGRFLKNKAIEGPDLGPATKIETIGRYPFCIAFENSICVDYVTEKLFDPFYAGTVPIYMGAPNANDFAPQNSYIDVANFSGPRELAAYLAHLVKTPREYDAYFEWRTRPFTKEFESRLDMIETPAFCQLLEEVHRQLSQRDGVPTGHPTLEFGMFAFLGTHLRRWKAKRRRGSRGAATKSA